MTNFRKVPKYRNRTTRFKYRIPIPLVPKSTKSQLCPFRQYAILLEKGNAYCVGTIKGTQTLPHRTMQDPRISSYGDSKFVHLPKVSGYPNVAIIVGTLKQNDGVSGDTGRQKLQHGAQFVTRTVTVTRLRTQGQGSNFVPTLLRFRTSIGSNAGSGVCMGRGEPRPEPRL